MDQYVGAPYNFVPITKNIYQRYQNEEELPKHNIIDTKRYSGELQCRITALTDIFIGGGDDVKTGGYSGFAHSLDGIPCIPGSSIKGLARSNMQVLSLGSIAGDVEDYNIMYRQVGAAQSRIAKYYRDNILNVKQVTLGQGKDGKPIRTTVPKNVKAGYIRKEGESYVIYPTEKDAIDKNQFGECNYYPVSELAVFRAKEDARLRNEENPFSFFEELNLQLQHRNNSSSNDFKVTMQGKRKRVQGPENKRYVPYIAKILYKLKGNLKVVSIIKHNGTCKAGYQEGYVISTGKMQEKKVFYVVPRLKEDHAIQIPESDILSFKRDYENKKNKLHGTIKEDNLREKCRDFFALPKTGELKPVFYAERGGRLYFGYTPFLRIFYEHSIMHGVSREQREYMKENGDLKKPVLDYPSAILGYASDQSSYKSRVSFEDFRLQIPGKKNASQYVNEQQYNVEMVQGEPKLSSYWDYLVQDHTEYAMTYNEDQFELRGIKQYWLHETTAGKEPAKNKKAASRFQPLKKGVSFKGKIRFKNLSADELGLLIWSLSLETDSNQNIGRAKAFGYGRINLELMHLKLYDYQKMYHGPALCMDVFEEKTAEEINQFVESYKSYMNQNYKKPSGMSGDIMTEKGVDALLKMKSNIPNEKDIAYMSLDHKDYQNRKRPLHSIDQLLNKETPEEIREITSGRHSERKKQKPDDQRSDIQNYKKSYKDPAGEKPPTMGDLFKNIKLD